MEHRTRCKLCFKLTYVNPDGLCTRCRNEVDATMNALPAAQRTLHTDIPQGFNRSPPMRLRDELGIVYPSVLAEALGMSESTLQLWRQNGNGPKFVKLGKNVFYRVTDVRDWLQHNITDRVRDTSESVVRHD